MKRGKHILLPLGVLLVLVILNIILAVSFPLKGAAFKYSTDYNGYEYSFVFIDDDTVAAVSNNDEIKHRYSVAGDTVLISDNYYFREGYSIVALDKYHTTRFTCNGAHTLQVFFIVCYVLVVLWLIVGIYSFTHT